MFQTCGACRATNYMSVLRQALRYAGITGSPVSAATAAIISTDLLGGAGIELKDVMMICIPASLIAILVAAFVQNHIGKELVDDEVYKERVAKGIIDPEHDSKLIDEMIKNPNPRAKYAVVAFLPMVMSE